MASQNSSKTNNKRNLSDTSGDASMYVTPKRQAKNKDTIKQHFPVLEKAVSENEDEVEWATDESEFEETVHKGRRKKSKAIGYAEFEKVMSRLDDIQVDVRATKEQIEKTNSEIFDLRLENDQFHAYLDLKKEGNYQYLRPSI